MPQCKDCKSEMVQDGYHKEAPDYKKWVCPVCDKKKK